MNVGMGTNGDDVASVRKVGGAPCREGGKVEGGMSTTSQARVGIEALLVRRYMLETLIRTCFG